MKTDAYTKGILTIIAACLIILASKSFDSGLVVSTAQAQNKNIVDVNLVQINGVAVNSGVVSSSAKGASLPVNIQRISGEDIAKTHCEPLPVVLREH